MRVFLLRIGEGHDTQVVLRIHADAFQNDPSCIDPDAGGGGISMYEISLVIKCSSYIIKNLIILSLSLFIRRSRT